MPGLDHVNIRTDRLAETGAWVKANPTEAASRLAGVLREVRVQQLHRHGTREAVVATCARQVHHTHAAGRDAGDELVPTQRER